MLYLWLGYETHSQLIIRLGTSYLMHVLASVRLLFLPLVLAGFLSACAGKSSFGSESALSTPAIGVSAAMQPVNRELAIRCNGKVKLVCPDDGCWIALQDDANLMRVEFRNSEFYAPPDIAERMVIVEGVVVEKSIARSSKGYDEFEKLCNEVSGGTAQLKRRPVFVAYRLELH